MVPCQRSRSQKLFLEFGFLFLLLRSGAPVFPTLRVVHLIDSRQPDILSFEAVMTNILKNKQIDRIVFFHFMETRTYLLHSFKFDYAFYQIQWFPISVSNPLMAQLLSVPLYPNSSKCSNLFFTTNNTLTKRTRLYSGSWPYSPSATVYSSLVCTSPIPARRYPHIDHSHATPTLIYANFLSTVPLSQFQVQKTVSG